MSNRSVGNQGFTVLEVLFAAALATISMMATLEMVRFLDRAQRSVSASANFQQLTNHVGLVFSQSGTCAMSSLIGRTITAPPPLNVSPITANGSTVIAEGDVVFGFKVTTLELSEELGRVVYPNGNRFLIMNLRLAAEKEQQSNVGPKILESNTKIGIVTNSEGRIQSCGNNLTLLQDACTEAGGEYDAGAHRCSLDALLCTKNGGTWDSTTSRCDGSTAYYTASANCAGPGVCELTVNCDAGDSPTGGGSQNRTPAATSQSYPLVAGGRITGWRCSGPTLLACHVVCHRRPG